MDRQAVPCGDQFRGVTELDGIISRASGCRHRINTSVFNVSSVPRIGARSIGASLKGRICPSHSNIISMEAVMDPAGVPTVCFIRKYEVGGHREAQGCNCAAVG